MFGFHPHVILLTCCLSRAQVMAFIGRGPGGPKTSAWTRTKGQQLENFFARMATPAADRLGEIRWLFAPSDELSVHMCAQIGARVSHVVFNFTGELLAKGSGSVPGQGTCHEVWRLDGREVAAHTLGASCELRGGSGDLQLRPENGEAAWFLARHVVLPDDEPAASTRREAASTHPF